MATTLRDICDELEVDLCLTRLQHIAARRRLQRDHTSETRAAEAECRARLDVILDLLVELKETARREPGGRPAGRPQLFAVPRRSR